jgi:hypothetical protein
MKKLWDYLFLASFVPLLIIASSYTSNISYRSDLQGFQDSTQTNYQNANYVSPPSTSTTTTTSTTSSPNYTPPPPAYPAYTAPSYTQPVYTAPNVSPQYNVYPTYQYSAFPNQREQDEIFRANQNR